MGPGAYRVPTLPGKSWIFFLENSRNHFDSGKSSKLKLTVLESPGKISLKVMHFSSGLNGKQAAIVDPIAPSLCGMLMNFATFEYCK